MRIMGDAVFAGLGKIRNALMDPISSDPGSPAESQVWYNSTDKALKFYDGTAVQVIAVGGNTASLQSEIDAIETGAGLNSDGTFTAPAGTNYLGSATTIKGMSVLLDTALKAVSDAQQATQGNVDTLETVIANLIEEVDAIETGVGLNTDGTYTAPAGTNYIGAASTVKAATVALDTQVKTNADAIATKVSKSGDTMSGSLAMGGNTITGLPAATTATEPIRKAEFDAMQAGMDFQPDVKGFEEDFTAGEGAGGRFIYVDGSTFSTGVAASANDIVVVDDAGVILSVAYDVSAQGEGAIVWSQADNYFVYWDGTNWTEHGGLSGVTAGIGLVKSGNTLDVNMGAGIGQLPTDEIGIDVRANSGLWLTEDGVDPSTNTAAQLAIRLDGASLALGASGIKIGAGGVGVAEINAAIAGNGLTGGGGSALSVGAGDGITVTADGIEIDETHLDTLYARLDGADFTGPVTLQAPATDSEAARKLDVDTVNTRLTNSYFFFNGSTSTATHTVTHNLGQKYPNVTVYDSTDKVIIPDEITAIDTNSLTISFSSAITCKAAVAASKV